MKKYLAKIFIIFLINSVLIFPKQKLKFELSGSDNEGIKILIKRDGKVIEPKKFEPIIRRNTRRYVVKKDDTLFSIAKRFKTTVEDLQRTNRIKNKRLIYPGQRLIY